MLWRPFLTASSSCCISAPLKKRNGGYMELIADAHLVFVYNIRPGADARTAWRPVQRWSPISSNVPTEPRQMRSSHLGMRTKRSILDIAHISN